MFLFVWQPDRDATPTSQAVSPDAAYLFMPTDHKATVTITGGRGSSAVAVATVANGVFRFHWNIQLRIARHPRGRDGGTRRFQSGIEGF